MRLPFRLAVKRLARICFLLVVAGLIPFFLWFQTQDPEAYRFNGMVESEAETVGPVDTVRILSIDVHPGPLASHRRRNQPLPMRICLGFRCLF